MTHICVSNLTTIGSVNGLSPGRRRAITWTNTGILLIRHLGTNFSEILIEILTFSFKENALESVVCEMAAILSWPQCVNNISALAQIMTWCWSSDKPLPELMLICVTQPQWVNYDELLQGLFCVCAQPIRNGVTLQCYLLLAGCIHVMIPASDIWRSSLLDSLAPQRCEWNFRFNSQTQSSDGCLKCFLWNWLRWMSLNLSDDKSILFQLMTCCCPATSHYLS